MSAPTYTQLASALGDALDLLEQFYHDSHSEMVRLHDILGGVERDIARIHFDSISPERRAELRQEWED